MGDCVESGRVAGGGRKWGMVEGGAQSLLSPERGTDTNFGNF